MEQCSSLQLNGKKMCLLHKLLSLHTESQSMCIATCTTMPNTIQSNHWQKVKKITFETNACVVYTYQCPPYLELKSTLWLWTWHTTCATVQAEWDYTNWSRRPFLKKSCFPLPDLMMVTMWVQIVEIQKNYATKP